MAGENAKKPLSNKLIAGLLCAAGFFGISGLHYFYMKRIGFGILFLLTGGLFVVGTIADFIKIVSGRFDSLGALCVTAKSSAEHERKIKLAKLVFALQAVAVALLPTAVAAYLDCLTALAEYILKVLQIIFVIIMSFGMALLFAPDIVVIPRPVFEISLPVIPLIISGLVLTACFLLLMLKGNEKARYSLLAFLACMIPPVLMLVSLVPFWYSLPIIFAILALCFSLYCPQVNYYFGYKAGLKCADIALK